MLANSAAQTPILGDICFGIVYGGGEVDDVRPIIVVKTVDRGIGGTIF